MRAFSIALLLPCVLGLLTPTTQKQGSGTLVTLPMSIRTNKVSNIAEADRARARSLVKNLKEDITKLKPRDSVPLTNGIVTYTVSVGVGSPPTNYDLTVDTGSSNTFVGAGKAYVVTSTSVDTGEAVNVTYGSGSFSGTEYFDQLTLSPTLVFNQSIGVANASTGFSGVDGILGVGPTDLTQDTVAGSDTIPTIVDSLYRQGLIDNDRIGVYFEPTVGADGTNGTGQLDLGDVDSSKISGPITYTAITSTSPASTFWGIDQSIYRADDPDTPILSQTAGIVDTGTTLILLATDAFQAYKNAAGATLDNNTSLLTVTEAQFRQLPSLFFQIGDTSFELTADAQAWPQKLNSAIGGDSNSIYLIVSDLGTPSGQGLDFINGQTFLQRFYSVYDTGNQQVGLAQTSHTFDKVNVPPTA